MKFLFCSMGNIAQRHFRNLKILIPDCLIDVVCSKKEQYRIFNNDLNISYVYNLKKIYNINNIYYNLDEALLNKYDAVFICSLPPDRVNIAIECAEKENNLFIEKPLSNNLDKIYKLQGTIEREKVKCAIGFQMRFHPLLNKLKEMVDNNEFGKIYRIEVTHCSSIYNWTKGRDLSNFYALKEKNGGGVLLSQIHEIDYLTWIFGKLYPISAIYGQWLNIPNSDVEDNITILSNLELTNVCIPAIINLDFLSKIPKRTIKVYGTENFIEIDLIEGSYKVGDFVGIAISTWNDLFMEEMKAFLNLLNSGKRENLATLEDGIHSLEYCMDIKNNFTKINL